MRFTLRTPMGRLNVRIRMAAIKQKIERVVTRAKKTTVKKKTVAAEIKKVEFTEADTMTARSRVHLSPSCCGLREMAGVGNLTEAQIHAIVPGLAKQCGYVIATTIQKQENTEKWFAEAGWTTLSKSKNPNTKNTVTLWGHEV